MNTRNIRVSFEYPPIPARDMDWSAIRENYEPPMAIGRGIGPVEAVQDLLNQEETDDKADDMNLLLASRQCQS